MVSALNFVLIGQLALLSQSRRIASISRIHSDSNRDTDDALVAAPNLPWKVDEFPLFGAEDGVLGMQVEVTLPTGSGISWTKMAVLGKNIDTIIEKINEQLQSQGIAASITLNEFHGVAEYQLFGASQLAAVTTGLYEQLASGVSLPEGADFDAPTDGNGNPIRNLKQELEENPALKGAVKDVSLNILEDDEFSGLPFSPKQFLLEIEVDKYELVASKTGSYALAYMVGNLGAGKREDIVKTIYGLLGSQLVEQVSKNGINILISGPSFASRHFSRLGPLSAEVADALHAGEPSRSVIPLDCANCENEMTDLDQEYPEGLPDGKIPESVTMWKRTVENEAKVTGFRLVMTVTSVNERFAVTKLPVLRDGVATVLQQALAENLGKVTVMGHKMFDVTVNVQRCGWKPSLASQPPFPHDEGGCASPPNKDD